MPETELLRAFLSEKRLVLHVETWLFFFAFFTKYQNTQLSSTPQR